jgi:hypothetical protein
MTRRAVLVMAMVAFGAIGVAPARANQSPAGCARNALALDITKDKTVIHREGDVIAYGIFVGNPGNDACDYTAVSVDFTVPGGQPQTVATNLNLPSNTPLHQIATVNYTVPPTTTPVDLDAHGHAAGTLHDAPANHAGAVTKDVGTTSFAPSMALTKTGSTIGGVVPLAVTYTYTLTNTTPVSQDLPDFPIVSPAVTDNLCAPLTYIAGDANGDQQLNVGETWTYTCTKTYTAAGCYTNVANATGTVVIDNRPVTAGPVSWQVCATAPKGAVKGASAGSHCTVAPTTSVKVRAREFSTVRVRVRVNGKNVAKSLVHISGPGVKKKGRTNKNGMVTFRVRPKKTGRLKISSDQCGVAARLSVKPARQVVSPALPEVTG